jgi:hypothetical protein
MIEAKANEQRMRQSTLRLRIFVWIFFPFLGVVCGEVFGMGVLLGIGLGVGLSFMLDGTLRLMSSDTKIFRVRRDLEEG